MESGSIRILLVEDNADDEFLLRRALAAIKTASFDLTQVGTLSEALARLRADHFDVVLLDLSLPDCKGLETVQRTLATTSKVPIVVLTGLSDEVFALKAVREGAQDYLAKGHYDGNYLVRSIRYAIERHHILAERERVDEALKVSRGFAQGLIESSIDMIIAVDANKQITEFNLAAQKTFGYLPEEILGKPVSILFADPTEGRRIHEAVLSQGKCVDQITNVRKNGQRFPTSLSASVVRNQRGDFVGVMGISRDITEQLKLEAELRQSQKLESVGRLAAGVAHDFNNILTIIQGHTGRLLASPDLAPPLAESLTQTALAAEHAASLTRQLLTFSRKQIMQPRLLDLNEVLNNVTKLLHRLLGEALVLSIKLEPLLPVIHADPGMMEQVVINLAVNAREAMPNGGRLLISTAVAEILEADLRRHPEARAGRFVRIDVIDTGCGMDEATLSRIYEPFFTTKEPGKGTGLGLATVYGIVQSHQGWIEVTSRIGHGTTFRVFVPAVSGSAASPPQPMFSHEQVHGTETILVVEDEPALRELVSVILQDAGYQVLEAATGVLALILWEEHKDQIDLLLTDMVLPDGLTGRQLAEKLLAEKPGLKILYTSGHSADLLSEGFALRAGISFLQKPYRPPTLLQTMRECLDACS